MGFKKIFFSYARTDGSVFALRLARDLKARGFDVWIDQEDIRAGAEWDIEIEHALETCDCLLFLESEKSVASNNVLDEVYFALEQKKRVIPVIVHDAKTPYRLQRLQHIDCSANYDLGLQQLVAELQEGRMDNPWITAGDEHMAGSKQAPPVARKWLPLLLVILLVLAAGAAYYFKGNRQALPAANTEQADVPLSAIAGNWRLVSVTPEATLGKGYLSIDTTANGRLQFRSAFQFYYPQTNDTLFLQVFNGLAGCKACDYQPEIQLATEDIVIGSQQYMLSRNILHGKVTAIDTTGSRSANQSVPASCTLLFTGRDRAAVKVRSADTIRLNSGITLPSFEYTFGFRKSG